MALSTYKTMPKINSYHWTEIGKKNHYSMKQDNFFTIIRASQRQDWSSDRRSRDIPSKKTGDQFSDDSKKKFEKLSKIILTFYCRCSRDGVTLLWRLLWRYCDAAATLLRRCCDVTATKREAKRATCTFFQAHRRRSHEIEDRTRGETEWERERERKGVLTRSAQAGFMSGAGLIYL